MVEQGWSAGQCRGWLLLLFFCRLVLPKSTDFLYTHPETIWGFFCNDLIFLMVLIDWEVIFNSTFGVGFMDNLLASKMNPES